MAVFDRLVPGRVKSNLREEIERIDNIGKAEVQRKELHFATALLWQSMCDSARGTMHNWFIDVAEKEMDWGLTKKRTRVGGVRLAVIYWWLLLYHLVMFKNRGVNGVPSDEMFRELRDIASEFVEHLGSPSLYNFVSPGAWDSNWESQVSLEATLGMYNRIMQLVGAQVDLDQRIYRVSLFTTAMERAFEERIQKPVSGRLDGG
jgi:hypothetical protein